MIFLKTGVSISGIQPEIVLAFVVAQAVFARYKQILVVTSVMDGEHMKGSLHYVGAAIDLLIPVDNGGAIHTALIAQLGDNYDVIDETDHFHIEFQPKHGAN